MVKLTLEDKEKYKTEIKTASLKELWVLAMFIKEAPLTKADKKFCFTHLGIRFERVLRDIIKLSAPEGRR
jgi:hypothetical protein